MHENDSDEELITCFAKTGQFAAFDIVHRRNHRPLLRFLIGKVGNRQTAEDIAQETWIKVVNALRNGGYQVHVDASFRTFLHRVADNCRIDVFRRDNIRGLSSASVDSSDETSDVAGANELETGYASEPALVLEQKRLFELFHKFLLSLSSEQRETASLYFMGHTREEIAHCTGVGLETVKTRIRLLMPKLEAWRDQQRLERSGG